MKKDSKWPLVIAGFFVLMIATGFITGTIVRLQTENNFLEDQVIDQQVKLNGYESGMYGMYEWNEPMMNPGQIPTYDESMYNTTTTTTTPMMGVAGKLVNELAMGEMLYVSQQSLATDGYGYYVDVYAEGTYMPDSYYSVCVMVGYSYTGYDLCGGEAPMWIGNYLDQTRMWVVVNQK